MKEEDLIRNITMLGADVEGVDQGIITVEFFPDRPDLLSVEGVARALRSFLGIEPGLKTYPTGASEIVLRVEENVIPLRGVVHCLNVRNVRLDDDLLKELMDLQEDLHWALGRDRKKVAIGVHDSSRITPPYTYRAALPDKIVFEPLGMPGMKMTLGEVLEKHPKGVDYRHILEGFSRYPVILDSKGEVLSMPPIINGELTKLHTGTTDIFVEMTGTDERAVKKTMNILTAAFGENGWTLEKVNVFIKGRKIVTPDLAPEKRKVSNDYINRLLGLHLTPTETAGYLKKTGYGAHVNGDELDLSVPAWRADILHDIDIVEDAAIGYGYEAMTPILPEIQKTGGLLSSTYQMKKARTAMIGLGFTEAVTLMITSEKANNENMGLKEEAVKVLNPLTEEHSIMRTNLLSSLLEVLRINKHHELPQMLFEVGTVLKLDPQMETGARSEQRLAWTAIHGKANFSEAKAIFKALARDLLLEGSIESRDHPSFIKGRCAGIEGTGIFGELHPRVISAFELEYPVIAMEIRLKD